MNQITKNLFIGSWQDSVDPQQLIRNNIKYIVGININNKSQNNLDLYKKLNIKYMHITENDTPPTNIFKHFTKTNEFINNAILQDKNVLVHCTMGISRATTIVVAYLLWIYYIHDKEKDKLGFNQSEISIFNKKYRLNDICNYIGAIRHQINPNPGFIQQLKKYEKCLINLLIKN